MFLTTACMAAAISASPSLPINVHRCIKVGIRVHADLATTWPAADRAKAIR